MTVVPRDKAISGSKGSGHHDVEAVEVREVTATTAGGEPKTPRRRMRLPTIAENNRIFVQLLAALPAAGGSTISVMLVISDVWALISLGMGRFRMRYAPTDRWVVVPAVLYTVVMLASIAGHAESLAGLGPATKPLMYLSPLLVIPRLRAAAKVDYFMLFVRAAPLCGLLALPIMGVQYFTGASRIAAGAGNAFPFAMICVFVGFVGLLNLRGASVRMAAYAVAGFFACSLGLALSGTRTVWPVFFVNLVFAIWFLVSSRSGRLRKRLVVCSGVLLAVFVIFGYAHERDRISMLVNDVHAVFQGTVPEDSLSIRMALWSAGAQAFSERPVFGFGANHRHDIIDRVRIPVKTPAGEPQRYAKTRVTHFHNGFLTAGIDAGILGVIVTAMLLFSPLAIAFAAPRDERFRMRITFALFLFFTYAITGSFNIMFGQDLIDALFVSGLLMLATSIATGPAAPIPPGERTSANAP
ncbi:O-antigen ligase family protein [Pararhizobium mangrovi]|uniref:O-antigen ligase family protein n=1 Tax=Pararhizobium mangrovi TaxID=2590452 RepID=A0A506U6J3_9HYPH|nr:O-antigen ligase family protein [Pararhizobium mangrovi]TPW28684.1 O-antigen ligase family protein [Pararhizobium mangrovi]